MVTEPLRVRLVDRPDARMTGLRRYSESLLRHLEGTAEIEMSVAHPKAVPSVVANAGRRLGWDLNSFFASYPFGIETQDADVYHLTSETLATLLLAQRVRPSIVTVHGMFSYLLRKSAELSVHQHAVHRISDALAVAGLRRATSIIAVSHYMKECLVNFVGIDGGRIDVIHEAVDHDVFKPLHLTDESWTRFGLSRDEKYVLFVGSEQQRKNLTTLIEAFSIVAAAMPEARLLKVGQPELGDARDALMGCIRDHGLSEKVHFLEHVEDRLPELYNLCSAFVFPSRYEGFGFPPLEAMSCGAPVVCSFTSSLPEVVGDAALLVNPMSVRDLAEAMEAVLVNGDLALRLRGDGLVRAQEFTWGKVARETGALYERVANTAPRDRSAAR